MDFSLSLGGSPSPARPRIRSRAETPSSKTFCSATGRDLSRQSALPWDQKI